MIDLGLTNSIDIIDDQLSIAGKSLIDVGCGDLGFTRLLAEAGADVLAIDPDLVQAEKNLAAAPIPRIRFVQAGADAIPAEENSADGVFFSFSLHHIPETLYPKTFSETKRVLVDDGFLCVIEPTDCPMNQVMRLFHDEDAQREAAWNALEDIAKSGFRTAKSFQYHSFVQYDSWEMYADRMANRSFNELYTESDVRNEKVKEAFLRLGGPELKFQSPKRMMVLSDPGV
jgi:ubiquinone/menaquinone biosynthesis C-methylase UbiE